jgi:hypothetical protein
MKLKAGGPADNSSKQRNRDRDEIGSVVSPGCPSRLPPDRRMGRDLGSDPALCHQRMLEGLCQLIGTATVTSGRNHHPRERPLGHADPATALRFYARWIRAGRASAGSRDGCSGMGSGGGCPSTTLSGRTKAIAFAARPRRPLFSGPVGSRAHVPPLGCHERQHHCQSGLGSEERVGKSIRKCAHTQAAERLGARPSPVMVNPGGSNWGKSQIKQRTASCVDACADLFDGSGPHCRDARRSDTFPRSGRRAAENLCRPAVILVDAVGAELRGQSVERVAKFLHCQGDDLFLT